MKVLCKKSIIRDADIKYGRRRCEFIKDSLYECYYFTDKFIFVKDKINPSNCSFPSNEWSFGCSKDLEKYFYSPEETINVLRTKIIDKILNE
jgi:hypothetical protein